MGSAKQFPIPEKDPFRITQDIPDLRSGRSIFLISVSMVIDSHRKYSLLSAEKKYTKVQSQSRHGCVFTRKFVGALETTTCMSVKDARPEHEYM
jgi:hypothetical protein